MRRVFALLLCVCVASSASAFWPWGKSASRDAQSHYHQPDKKLSKQLKKAQFTFGAPVHIRIFKKEKKLEVWLARAGRFEKFRTYPICAYSGTLGPKHKEGDNQAPEGFYHVTAGDMNPNSRYHLSFNLGYPNRYDQQHGRTGSYLMVHGDCVSRGCYAMTDEGIEDIYTLMQGAFARGQTQVQVAAFPFRMKPRNMRSNHHAAFSPFWFNLKEGYDYFGKHGVPPVVTVANKKYQFSPHHRLAAR